MHVFIFRHGCIIDNRTTNSFFLMLAQFKLVTACLFWFPPPSFRPILVGPQNCEWTWFPLWCWKWHQVLMTRGLHIKQFLIGLKKFHFIKPVSSEITILISIKLGHHRTDIWHKLHPIFTGYLLYSKLSLGTFTNCYLTLARYFEMLSFLLQSTELLARWKLCLTVQISPLGMHNPTSLKP